MRSSDEIDQLLAEIEKELKALDVRRSELLVEIAELRQEKALLFGAHEVESQSAYSDEIDHRFRFYPSTKRARQR